MARTAHYVSSSHWDREWYDSFQGFRMRLVSMLDEVFDVLDGDPGFKRFVMDGQVIPILDYLEIRPETAGTVRRRLEEGRIRIGPWYVLPDEWLVSGESLVRNLEAGMETAAELGAEPSRAGFVCDMFGHTGQLPQILGQMNILGAIVWRGLHEREHGGQFNWRAPDGTVMPAYRFGRAGYCSYAIEVRGCRDGGAPPSFAEMADRLVLFTLEEAKRTPTGPILLFDGGDHLEIEPATTEIIAAANERLAGHGIEIVHSDLDSYLEELAENQPNMEKMLTGELRESGRDPLEEDEHWLIPGVLSSRIHLKQRNAECEDELCLWAEPFSAFASELGGEYPEGYLRTAWKHLLENHPHDSICGCSIDQVHRDMIYRFDQSMGISSRLTARALGAIALASAPEAPPENSVVVTVFNPTSADIDEPVDIDIPLPIDWPATFREFFGYEEKFAFRILDAEGSEIPYQLVGQRRNRKGFRHVRRKFPLTDDRHVVSVTARLLVPAMGYTTLTVAPAEGPTRYSGSMSPSHRSIENEFLHVQAETNGTITVTDKRTGKRFEQLLTFEERADIGDGWYHGTAVNDRIHTSAASNADIALVADGPWKATLRITVTMNVPERFDFRAMERSGDTTALTMTSEVTLRRGADRVEVTTVIDNTARDHRVRVLFPTNLTGETYLCDSAFDVVERPVALAEDNDERRELDVETRPQVTWTAFGDGETGLAVVSRGLPESAVRDTEDRAIALTLLRGFRRVHLADDSTEGQVLGKHSFRYFIVPYSGEAPVEKLFRLGQRVLSPARISALSGDDLRESRPSGGLPPVHSFLSVEGGAVVTSVRKRGGKLLVRLFNPRGTTEKITLKRPAGTDGALCVTLDGRKDDRTVIVSGDGGTLELLVPPKRIATVMM